MQSTADHVLAALQPYDLSAKRGGRYLSNSPFRPGSNSHAFSLIINGPEHGAWVDFVSGEKGSLYDLAKHLGIPIPQRDKTTRTLVATYDYVDAHGTLIYQACRYEPGKNGRAKEFTQRVPDGQGGWIWSMSGITRVLYRLPELIAGVAAGEFIYIVEGEKDADLLTMYGLTATTNVGGAGKWVADYNEVLRGAHVVILPDNDKPGAAHAQKVARALQPVAATVRIIELPGLGPKGDVSDWFAAGHTLEELHELVATASLNEPEPEPEQAGPQRIELMKHPTTGQPLYLPPGYSIYNGIIMRTDEMRARHLYSGMIAVTGTGTNLHTGDETVTVVYDRYNNLVEATVPRLALTSGQKCAEALGQGGYVHSGNSRELSRYLVEFIRANESTLPRVNLVDRLGTVGETTGLILPAGPIGIEGETRYTGSPISVGTDRSAYPAVLSEAAATWDNLTAFWAVFALGLAGPALARMRPDRNPVVLLANASGSGKTTLLNFTIGAYGDPLVKPVRIQCGSGTTTAKGISQSLAQANGVPVHLEDIHMLMEREPAKFAGLIYDYANGQLRSFGTLDQRGGGGTHLGGTMLMSGEMSPELQYEGSQRRLMVINCRQWAPLGAEAKSQEGGLRAEVLNSAWKRGAGLFAHELYSHIWANWGQLERDAALFHTDSALSDLQAWRPLLATAAAVLRTALTPLRINLDYAQLLKQWAGLYMAGQRERDPAREAFDRAITMLSQCDRVTNSEHSTDGGYRSSPTWEWLMYERKMVAAHRIGDSYWRVLTTSPQWKEVVGAGTVDMFGDAWLRAGLIQPHNGKRPISDRVHVGPGKGNLQCICIPTSQFEASED